MIRITTASIALVFVATASATQDTGVQRPTRPSGSLFVRQGERHDVTATEDHQLQLYSPFVVPEPEPRRYEVHDLVQIIVRETSRTRRTQDMELTHEWDINGGIDAWPDFDLSDLLQLRLFAGRTTLTPELKMDFTREFTGEGEYQRRDDMSDRLTAEVIEVLPNGNLILEARTTIATDDEESVMNVTGICRPEDITAANTILSNQIHDLRIVRHHEGELPRTAKKGIIARVLEAIFAF